ncbi:uncharacterized protein LOC119097477 [Pollicipes pollicipes]|uniref:uncharacterized protein LOC119097477 n=1 Tax=Pollicipes pollicipes TaxID=41117 RepID=UPI001884CD30|nr:uncharacterized protein LOC119097477 [Pollicipes pollicipes]
MKLRPEAGVLYAPSYHQTSYKEPDHYDTPYQFDYAVHDHYSGAVFSQKENRDNKNVNGYCSTSIAAALLAVAAAAHANSYAPKPAYSHGPSYHQPSYSETDHYDTPYQFDYAINDYYSGAVYAPQPAYSHDPSYHQSSYKEPANYDTPYQFDYAVNDHYSGAVFSQNENSDTKNVNGHVTYVADHDDYGGYIAEMTYTGEPRYEEHKPSYHPVPAYKPAGSYAPAPAYKPDRSHAPAPAYKTMY